MIAREDTMNFILSALLNVDGPPRQVSTSSRVFCQSHQATFKMYMYLLSCSAAQPCETLAPASNQSPNPNNPAEYCSTIPPLQQAEASGVLSSPPPTVMVPVGVLKQSGSEGM